MVLPLPSKQLDLPVAQMTRYEWCFRAFKGKISRPPRKKRFWYLLYYSTEDQYKKNTQQTVKPVARQIVFLLCFLHPVELIWKIKGGTEEGLGLRTGARNNKNPTHIKLLLPDANLVSISRNSTDSSSTVYLTRTEGRGAILCTIMQRLEMSGTDESDNNTRRVFLPRAKPPFLQGNQSSRPKVISPEDICRTKPELCRPKFLGKTALGDITSGETNFGRLDHKPCASSLINSILTWKAANHISQSSL